MRICYITNSAIPSTSANSIATVKICEAFVELKNEVILITREIKNQNENIFNFYNVRSKFKIVRIKNFKKFPLGFKYYLFSIISILKSLNYKPDFYITRNFFTCFLLVILKKKVIMEIHHDLNNESRIIKSLVKFTKYLNSKYVVRIVTITKGIRHEYVHKNYFNIEKTSILPSGSSIRNNFQFKIKKKNFNIGYLGSLYKSRGIDLIFRLSKIDRKNKYFLYGNLNEVSKLNLRNIPKNLKLNNHIPYKQVPFVLKKMDILLIPYISSITLSGNVGDITKYTSPLKLFDYLCAGKIIICSDYDVLKEIIKDKNNAIFVKNFKNPLSWKNEIFKLQNQLCDQLFSSL
ncbi:glycosyltransferase [Candidatus Pelagibacter sp.]|nr:glycosyltransferase [Candidatus Pelagibacter sp.]